MIVASGWLPSRSEAGEVCYLYTPSGYQGIGGASRLGPYSSGSQCQSVNSSYFHSRGRCQCQTVSSGVPSYGAPGAGSAAGQLGYAIGSLLGQMLRDALIGSPTPGPSPEQQLALRRQQEEAEALRRAQEAEAQRQREEAQRREAEARARWTREKHELLDQMIGLPRGGLGELGNCVAVPGPLGSTEVKCGVQAAPQGQLALAPTTVPSHDTRGLTEWERLHCAHWLSQEAARAAQEGAATQAREWSQQISALMARQPVQVRCPALGPTPQVAAGPTQNQRAQIELYSELLKSVQDQIVRRAQLEVELQRLQERRRGTERRAEEGRQRAEALRARAATPSLAGPPAGAASDLGEAEAALREAEGANAAAAAAEKRLVEERQRMDAEVQRVEKVFLAAQRDPQAAGELLKGFRSP